MKGLSDRTLKPEKKEISLLSGKLTMEDVLFYCLKTLTNEKDLKIAMINFLEAVGGYHKADGAYIFEIDEKNEKIDNTYEWYKQGGRTCVRTIKSIPLEWGDLWHRKLQEEGELYISSIEKLDHTSGLYRELQEEKVESFMMVALINEGKVEGILGLNNPRKEEGNMVLLHSVAEFVRVEIERRQMVRELEYMSYTDTLTGLKNRNHYNKLVKEYELHMPDSLGIIHMDINGLQRINENYGTDYGDYVIKSISGLMMEVMGEKVCRIGGDEFIALWADISQKQFREKVERLREALKKEKSCVVSLGCVWKEKEEHIQVVLQQAAELLAADKQSYYHTVLREGRNEICMGMASEVIEELKEGKFVIHYQPQVDIQTGKITGAEALVRKKGENDILIAPGKFIPLYEAEGVVGYIDLFVMKTACRDMKKWMEQGHKVHMSINFSRVTLMESGIVEMLKGICDDYQISSEQVTIEVTESASKMGNEQLKELIGEINRAGFAVSLDDFGSMYSNLSILSDMDFNEIKFDKSLIEELEYNPKSRIIMKNTVKMCQDLRGASLAEGIETKGQLELLMGYKCNYGQGYYFSKPVPEEKFIQILNESL